MAHCNLITARSSASIGDEIASRAPALPQDWSSAMQRRRFTQSAPLYQRLTEQAERLRKEAQSIPPGAQRNKLLLAAGRLETASHMQEWLSLRGIPK